jgi:hypothetical protein
MSEQQANKKAPEDTFNRLHNLVTDTLVDRVSKPECTTADIKAAIEWLSKNNITGVASEGSGLSKLRHLTVAVDPEEIRRRVNGA